MHLPTFLEAMQDSFMTVGLGAAVVAAFGVWLRGKVVSFLSKVDEMPSKAEWDEHRSDLKELTSKFDTFLSAYNERQKLIDFRFNQGK